MNLIYMAIVAIAFLAAAGAEVFGTVAEGDPGPMSDLTAAMMASANDAVQLAIGLIGMMTLFLGLMKVLEAAGGLRIIALLIRPIMVRLFPEIPPDHPAMGAMIMNMAANAMGLGNAATPFGIRAMQELDRLNPEPGTATNAMALFLAINTSSVTLLPTGIIALRVSTGSEDPAGIFVPTLFATLCSTTVAIAAAKLYQRFSPAPLGPAVERGEPGRAPAAATPAAEVDAYPAWVSAIAVGALFSLVPAAVLYREAVQAASAWIIPWIMFSLLAFGAVRRVPIYEAFMEGAKDGIQVAFKIIPYLVAILVAVGMFRASGALDGLVAVVGPVTGPVGMPAEAVPMALLRPLSGSGAYGVAASIMADPATGPDTYVGYLVSTLQGSTETTFYVLAVYFGAVQVRRIRHAMYAALTADVAGIAGAVVACRLLVG